MTGLQIVNNKLTKNLALVLPFPVTLQSQSYFCIKIQFKSE